MKRKISSLIIIILLIISIFNCNKSYATEDFTVNVEETINLQVSNVKYTDAVWTIEDMNIAKINKTGKSGMQIGSYINYTYSVEVEGVSKGTTKLTLQTSNGGIISQTSINVTNNLISFEFEKSEIWMRVNSQYKSNIIFKPSQPDIEEEILWNSSNKDVATVDNSGVVNSLKYGQTIITCTIGDKSASYILNVGMNFNDIKASEWYYNSVKYCYDNGIIMGTTDKTFSPNTNVTRGNLVTILWRMEGSPTITGEQKFPDVKELDYYYEAVKWAEQNRVVSGYDDGRFRPNNYITREQLATILKNYADYKKKDTSKKANLTTFKDYTGISSYAKDGIAWAVANKVMSGKENGTRIDPRGNATRAEAAAMIQNYCNYVGR